jgi:hypothetical protein
MTTREDLLQIEKNTDLVKGIFGGGTWLATLITSHFAEIEAWLRITSLCIGIAVGITTIISIRRKK